MSEAEDKVRIHELTAEHGDALHGRIEALEAAVAGLLAAQHTHEPEAVLEARMDAVEEALDEVEEALTEPVEEAAEELPEAPADVAPEAEEAEEELAPAPTHRLLRRVGNG